MLTDAELRMARRLATKKDLSAQNINSVLAIVPALVEEVERSREARNIGDVDEQLLELGDYLNHEAMDSGDPGGKLRDWSDALRALRSAAITFTPDERMSLYDMQADIEDSWDGDDKRTERALALLDRLLGATTHSQEPRLAGEEET